MSSIVATLHEVAMPMVRAFGHARTTRDVAEGVVLRLAWDGAEGLGECVPRSYVTGETPDSVFEALSSLDLAALVDEVGGGSYETTVPRIEALQLPARLRQDGVLGIAAACCLELALLDCIGRRTGRTIRDSALPLALPPEITATPAERYPFSRALDSKARPDLIFAEGDRERYQVLKIKVGLGRDVDLERVRAARDVLGSSFTISVDANMAWSLDEACQMADLLHPYGLAWYEEPLAKGAFEDYAELRRRTGIKIMLDESLCSTADATEALATGSCDLFNVRLSKCGGFLASLRLVELAHQHGLGVQLGTHPGAQAILRAAEWQFMHTVGGFRAVEAARSNVWFEEELVSELLEIDWAAGRVRPLEGAGLGVTLRPERLEHYTKRRATWDSSRGSWTSGDR